MPATEVQGSVRALAAVGVRHFVVSLPAPYDMGMLRAFAKDVMPALRDRQTYGLVGPGLRKESILRAVGGTAAANRP